MAAELPPAVGAKLLPIHSDTEIQGLQLAPTGMNYPYVDDF